MQSAVYVFDAYGTLFDVHSAAARHAGAIGERWQALSDIWRTKQLEYTWVRSLAGKPCSFWQVTEDGLDFAAQSVGGLDRELRDELLAAYRQLDAYDEVADVLAALRSQGSQVAILSNGDPQMLVDAVRSAGLKGAFDAVMSVESAGIFKVAPPAYQLVLDRFGVAAGEVSFQSSNRWDIAGAKAFGFKTVWINRGGKPDEYFDLPADRTVADLTAIVDTNV
ncbi:MAG: haloacid dehalogenase type II [Alphaproteobacteria bacterium]|nr:haloacid dehalogenase type II [Alphaproteobacteria bacterium]